MNLGETMTAHDAKEHFIQHTSLDVSIGMVELTTFDDGCGELEPIRHWEATIEDVYTGETGKAFFDEHYGAIGIEWDWN